MLALDTNVLVRILIDDTQFIDQCAAARALASAAGEVYVPQVVQIETVWVLESAYGFARRVRRIPQRRGGFFRLCDLDAGARPKYDFGDL